jgi:hypothetical protein
MSGENCISPTYLLVIMASTIIRALDDPGIVKNHSAVVSPLPASKDSIPVTDEVEKLHAEGLSDPAIARRLGIPSATVSEYLQSSAGGRLEEENCLIAGLS